MNKSIRKMGVVSILQVYLLLIALGAFGDMLSGMGGLRPFERGIGVAVQAQTVGTAISADGSLPNNNAILDIMSPATGDGKGMLIPRVTQAQRTSASSALAGGLLNDSGNLRGGAAQGLMVYQTDGTQGFYYNTSGTATPQWIRVGTGDGDGDFQSDGSVPMSGNLNMNSRQINNVAGINMLGPLNMNSQILTNVGSIDFSSLNVALGRGALSYSSTEGCVAVGYGATARYRQSGVAIGADADGDYNGIGIGYQADGQYSNIAIGFQASAYSGYDRIAIGRAITNRRNDSAVLRGSLYLDGGTAVMYRATVGAGNWSVKAFTIDHPLDPDHQVLRHFCVEGPEVWNMYAGRSQLTDGKATVKLPDYYTALNRVGSEVFTLTPIGGAVTLYVRREVEANQFVVGGERDVAFSWIVHVPRNDAACLEDLKRRPVEQRKDEMPPGQAVWENRATDTDVSLP